MAEHDLMRQLIVANRLIRGLQDQLLRTDREVEALRAQLAKMEAAWLRERGGRDAAMKLIEDALALPPSMETGLWAELPRIHGADLQKGFGTTPR